MHPVAVDAPVARLPPEILTLVFSILSSIAPPHRSQNTQTPRRKSTSPKYKDNLGWLNVTHVCQRWRDVSLNEPILWASDIVPPSVLGRLWAAEFLARAQNVPLTVTRCINDYYPGSLTDTQFIGANLARMCAIMDLRTKNLLTFCTPAPLLHTLNIRVFDQAPLPDGLLGGAAGLPNLRHLSVFAWDVLSWTPLLLRQLVSVDITISKGYVPGAILDSMFAALGRMPALERLALQLQLEDTDGVPLTLPPGLRHLTMRNYVQHELPILARLALPAGIRVRCIADWPVGHQADLLALFPAMLTCAHATAISRVDVKQVAADRERSQSKRDVVVGAWRSGETDGAPPLVVQFSGWEGVPPVLKSLASTHLETLAVGGDMPQWFHALRRASRLRHVTVKDTAVRRLCAGLERAPSILPALSALVVDVRTLDLRLAKAILVDELPRCLAARARSGNVLEELEVVGYIEDEECVRALQEAAPGLAIRWRWKAKEGDYWEAVCDSHSL
ncbi:hypothetical protein FA95DRAFT_663047 [Auriscalpium vulgare]|uniref:Uncharacterized protein n=1 Tax=Auriscalpium vulgare TaxID=40419 RepID=A0ACB8S1A1_9AGAM|nr:hypothetical protein FA95DRAFT_663047 [Auriscalpium vulgare]